jgi:hypothetical protein
MLLTAYFFGFLFIALGYFVGVRQWLFIFAGYHREGCSEKIKNKDVLSRNAGVIFVAGGFFIIVAGLLALPINSYEPGVIIFTSLGILVSALVLYLIRRRYKGA